MSETTTTVAAPKTERAARLNKAAAKVANGKAKADNGMHEHKIKVLKIVATRESTMSELEKKTGLSRRAVYHSIYHLREDGFVAERQHEHSRERFFLATAKGKKAIAK